MNVGLRVTHHGCLAHHRIPLRHQWVFQKILGMNTPHMKTRKGIFSQQGPKMLTSKAKHTTKIISAQDVPAQSNPSPGPSSGLETWTQWRDGLLALATLKMMASGAAHYQYAPREGRACGTIPSIFGRPRRQGLGSHVLFLPTASHGFVNLR